MDARPGPRSAAVAVASLLALTLRPYESYWFVTPPVDGTPKAFIETAAERPKSG